MNKNADQYQPIGRVPRLALTLASSELGFNVHAGFLDALTRDIGIVPGHIGAASSGSYIGALFAAGYSTQEIKDITSTKEMQRSFLEWKAPFRGLGMLTNMAGHTGLLSGTKAANYLRKFLGDRRIEDCEHAELSLAVTNLTKGCSEIIRSGPLVDFIIASCSVPVLFRAQKIEGNTYCDGAVSDSSPFHHFIHDPKVSRILVHVVRHPDKESDNRNSMTIARVFGQSHQIITDRLLDLATECASLNGKPVTILTSVVPRYRWGKKGASHQLFEAGRETALKSIDQIKSMGV